MLDDERLGEIEKRAGKATPGPWAIDRERGTPWNVETTYSGADIALASQLLCDDRKQSRRTANAEFIAHAREDVPALVAEVRRLKEANERLIGYAVHTAACCAVVAERDCICGLAELLPQDDSVYVLASAADSTDDE